jgi:predicted nucleic acid-binding protein
MGRAKIGIPQEMNALVCDASVLFKLLVDEADSARAKALMASAEVIVPELVYAEIGNAMRAYVRRTGISPGEAEGLLEVLDRAPLHVRPIRPYLPRALAIASMINHPVYDCVYLALGESLDVPVVTADSRFLSAVRLASSSFKVQALADFG